MRGAWLADEAKAQEPDQGGVLDEKRTQLTHTALLLVELDEVGSHKRGARSGLLARPGAVGWPLGEVSPIQSTEQGAILLGDGAGGDEGRERRLRLGQRLGSDAVERPDGGLGRVGRTQGRHSPVEEVAEQCAQVVERSSEVRYHSDVSSSGGEVVVTRSYRC